MEKRCVYNLSHRPRTVFAKTPRISKPFEFSVRSEWPTFIFLRVFSDVPNVEEESAGKSDGEIDKKASSQPANSQPEETVLPPVSAATSPDVLPLPLKASSSSEASNSAATPVETENCEGATATCSTASSPSSDKAPAQSVYHVKWIKFKSSTVAIITQNENGPCPLLAIMNFLLLKGKIKLPGMIEMVTSGQLMEYLGDCIFENAPKVRLVLFAGVCSN